MKRDRTSVDLCNHTSCLFQDHGGRRIIVWLKLKFQVNRIASGCCTTESQCCRTTTADRKTVLEHLFHHAEQPVYTGLIIPCTAKFNNSLCHRFICEIKPSAIKIASFTTDCDIHFIDIWMIDKTGDHLLLMSQTYGDAAVMIIKHKVRRAIDWIYVKGKFTFCLRTRVALRIFLTKESRPRQYLTETSDQESLYFHIIVRAEICQSLFLVNHGIRRSRLDHFLSGIADQALNRTISCIHSLSGISSVPGNQFFSHGFRYRTVHGQVLLHFICAGRFLLLIHGYPRCYIPAAKPADRSLNFLTCTVKAPVPDTTEEPTNSIKEQIRKLERSKLEKQLAELYSKGKQETDLKA